jgi:hypothetical protein
MPEGLIIQQHYAIAFKTEQKDSHCNSVKHARGAPFGRLSKIVLKGASSHANSGINRQHRFVRL